MLEGCFKIVDFFPVLPVIYESAVSPHSNMGISPFI